jgi:class 3 adenylate cyclase/tetratricopeptide (TPR) repeat protein
MRCTKCGTNNPTASNFCAQCGNALLRVCANCGAENPAISNFCSRCGCALADTGAKPGASGSVHETGAGLSGERRHLTVLFCDLVGSTGIAAKLDPEEWRETVGGYQRAAADAISRFGGHVAKYLGDGVMAFFGYPEAHDNDTERAAYAGLAILDAITKLNEHPARLRLAARVGIDSGVVVVGAGAGKEADVFGDVPNVAARVEAAADPGTVLITAATHRLVSGLFVVEERGAQPLKGVEQPVQLYRVIQPSVVRSRLKVASARGLTPFVGRADESRLLLSRWERALDGEGQVVLVMGEAGIGKSRLVQRFHEEIAGTPHTWVECATAPFYQNTPFYPVADMLEQSFRWGGDESADERLASLEASLKLAGLKLPEAIPLIAPLLNLAVPERYPSLELGPDQQRKRLLATIVAWTLGAAQAQPLVILIEDLHWADPSTLELIQMQVEQGATSRLLLLYTARPEFQAQWPARAHHTQVTLSRLNARDVREMIAQVTTQSALVEETVATVVARTGGVPLFVEELTRAVLERGGDSANREIPATLHDSLMARLDRLGTAKEVAQVAAVIGREFSYELLHAVYPVPETDLQSALVKLADSELVYPRGIPPQATYTFKHVLIQDAAYEALLKTRRRELHRKIAQTVTEKFEELAETHPEALARHWTEAGETEPAVVAWTRAGKSAESRNAFSEALASYGRAVALLDLLPEAPERDLRELELRRSSFLILRNIKGHTAPETIDAIERAATLAEKSGNLTELVTLLIRRGFAAYFSGDVTAAEHYANQALELASRDNNSTNLAHVYFLQTVTRHIRGDLAGAEKYFAAGINFFSDQGFRQNPNGAVVGVFGNAAWNAWVLGHGDVARERMSQMVDAADTNNPFHVAASNYYAALLKIFLREYGEVEALSAKALDLCERHQFPQFCAYSRCVLGQARAQLGHATEGIELIRQGIVSLSAAGARGALRPNNYLAETLARQGDIVAALETVERALLENPDELLHRPEAFRLRGELRLKQGQEQLAEADFRASIALARSIGAKAWELRSTMSLARLLAKQGKPGEARAMLAEIYNWFTEGFDTTDLKEAKALLQELGG